MTLSDPRSYGGANGTNANVNDASALFGGSPERLAAIHAAARQAAAGPKPVLSAWERWEMGTLDGRPPSASRKAASAARTAVPVPPPAPPAPKIDLAELARIRKDARAAGEAEGRADGLAEGRKAGHTEGLATGLAAATVHAERLRALTRSFPDALRRAEGELAENRARPGAGRRAPGAAPHAPGAEARMPSCPLVRDLLHAEPALQRRAAACCCTPTTRRWCSQQPGPRDLQAAGWQDPRRRPPASAAAAACRPPTASTTRTPAHPLGARHRGPARRHRHAYPRLRLTAAATPV
jgi:flagellar assembly protein FliH